MSRSVLHYGQPDTNVFETEVDLAPTDVSGSRLAGLNVVNAGYEFGYQDGDRRQSQKPRGSFGFGGRAGQDFINLRPTQLGYLNWRTNEFQTIRDNPRWRRPRTTVAPKTIGFAGDDPIQWTINASSRIDCGNIWRTPGAGRIRYEIKVSGGQVEPVFTINQEARDWIEANATNIDPDSEATFGVVLHVDLNTIDRLEHRGRRLNRLGDTEDLTEALDLIDTSGRPLASMGLGQVFVPNRGGRVDILKRLWFDGQDWYLFMGCNVRQMRTNLLRGDLVIDPPISEESITANSDDALQGYPTQAGMLLSGFSNREYLGNYVRNYHSGWRFQTVPIGQGDTVNSATLEPYQITTGGGTATADLYGEDVDDAGTFTTTGSDITNRTRTTASTALTNADWPGSDTRASWTVTTIVQEIVDRTGWANNNDMAFVAISDNTTNSYLGFTDYNGSATQAADFNADVTAGSSDRDVNAAVDAFTLTEPVGTVNSTREVDAAADSLTLAEPVGTLNLTRETDAAVDSLTLTEPTGTINATRNVDATADAFTMTDLTATIGSGLVIDATTDTFTLSEPVGTVNLTREVDALVDALTMTDQTATVALDLTVAASTDALTITAQTATVTGPDQPILTFTARRGMTRMMHGRRR